MGRCRHKVCVLHLQRPQPNSLAMLAPTHLGQVCDGSWSRCLGTGARDSQGRDSRIPVRELIFSIILTGLREPGLSVKMFFWMFVEGSLGIPGWRGGHPVPVWAVTTQSVGGLEAVGRPRVSPPGPGASVFTLRHYLPSPGSPASGTCTSVLGS